MGRAKIVLLLTWIVGCYTLALNISAFNEHFDRSPPHDKEGTANTKFIRYNPFRIHVVRVEFESGNHVNLDVLKETSDKIQIGSKIEFVEKHGLLGKAWYQDKAFYESLEHGRTFQGAVHIGLFTFVIFLCFHIARRVFPIRTAAVITTLCLVTASLCFAVVL